MCFKVLSFIQVFSMYNNKVYTNIKIMYNTGKTLDKKKDLFFILLYKKFKLKVLKIRVKFEMLVIQSTLGIAPCFLNQKNLKQNRSIRLSRQKYQ